MLKQIKRKLLLVIAFFVLCTCSEIIYVYPSINKIESIHTKKTIGENIIIDNIEKEDISPEILVDIEMEDGTLGWCPVIYAKEQAKQEARAKADGFINAPKSGVHGEIRVMHTATETTNIIVIKIVADRYTSTQQETFFSTAQSMANYIVNAHPLNEFKPLVAAGKVVLGAVGAGIHFPGPLPRWQNLCQIISNRLIFPEIFM